MSKLDPHKTYRLRPHERWSVSGPGLRALYILWFMVLACLVVGLFVVPEILLPIAGISGFGMLMPTGIVASELADGGYARRDYFRGDPEKLRLNRPLKKEQRTAFVALPKDDQVQFWRLERDYGWSMIATFNAETQSDEAHEYWSELEPQFDKLKAGSTPEAAALARVLTKG